MENCYAPEPVLPVSLNDGGEGDSAGHHDGNRGNSNFSDHNLHLLSKTSIGPRTDGHLMDTF